MRELRGPCGVERRWSESRSLRRYIAGYDAIKRGLERIEFFRRGSNHKELRVFRTEHMQKKLGLRLATRGKIDHATHAGTPGDVVILPTARAHFHGRFLLQLLFCP